MMPVILYLLISSLAFDKPKIVQAGAVKGLICMRAMKEESVAVYTRLMIKSGARPAEPIEMKLGVKVPWDTTAVCTYSVANTTFAKRHNNTQDY